jgi:hypothetical protein
LDLFAGNSNQSKIEGLNIFSVLANKNFSEQQDTKEAQNDSELTQWALGLTKSFHENKIPLSRRSYSMDK